MAIDDDRGTGGHGKHCERKLQVAVRLRGSMKEDEGLT